jgi:hypothetical protein
MEVVVCALAALLMPQEGDKAWDQQKHFMPRRQAAEDVKKLKGLFFCGSLRLGVLA